MNPKWLNAAGELTWVNPLTNQRIIVPPGSLVHVDHIFPEAILRELPGFSELPRDVRRSILDNPINLQPMLCSANCSKGAKIEFSNGGWQTWNGQAVHSQYKVYLAEVQNRVQEMVKNAVK